MNRWVGVKTLPVKVLIDDVQVAQRTVQQRVAELGLQKKIRLPRTYSTAAQYIPQDFLGKDGKRTIPTILFIFPFVAVVCHSVLRGWRYDTCALDPILDREYIFPSLLASFVDRRARESLEGDFCFRGTVHGVQVSIRASCQLRWSHSDVIRSTQVDLLISAS